MTRARSAAFRAALDQADPAHKSRDHALISAARRLASLQAKRRGLRAKLRELDRQIKVTKAELKTLINEAAWTESGRASKVFGSPAGES